MNDARSPYVEYIESLRILRTLPEAQSERTRAIAATYDQSMILASNSVERSQERFTAGQESIERHLGNASASLAKVGETSRIPPRIKPSIIPASATTAELDASLRDLAKATSSLGVAVNRLIARQSAVVRPVLPPPPQAKPQRHNRLLIGVVVGIALILVILVIILATT